jgi:hypothetical protein
METMPARSPFAFEEECGSPSSRNRVVRDLEDLFRPSDSSVRFQESFQKENDREEVFILRPSSAAARVAKGARAPRDVDVHRRTRYDDAEGGDKENAAAVVVGGCTS